MNLLTWKELGGKEIPGKCSKTIEKCYAGCASNADCVGICSPSTNTCDDSQKAKCEKTKLNTWDATLNDCYKTDNYIKCTKNDKDICDADCKDVQKKLDSCKADCTKIFPKTSSKEWIKCASDCTVKFSLSTQKICYQSCQQTVITCLTPVKF